MQTQTQTKTGKLTLIAMLCAVAYLVMVVGRVPVVLFLKYDPKDVVIAIGGFLYGPLTSFLISAVVCLLEMVTVSDTGPIGLTMNVISSCAFACTAAAIYSGKHNIKRAVAGLVTGCLIATAVMLLWNYLITPLYMGVARKDVVALLVPAILPFNLLKGSLNAALTMLLYKPLVSALRKSGLLPTPESAEVKKSKVNIGVLLASVFVLATCVLLILVFQGKL